MISQDFPKHSGTDITAGVGADSFLSASGESDPWGEQCLGSLLDNMINHERVRYALPTREAAEIDNLESLPTILQVFRKTGVVEPITRFNASDALTPDHQMLARECEHFALWANRNATELRAWIDLHSQKNVENFHWERMRGKVQPWVEEFYSTTTLVFEELSRSMHRPQSRIVYAFDVMARGLQYVWVFAMDGTTYFPHPMRKPLLQGQATTTTFEDLKTWSWGRLITRLITEGKVKRNPEHVSEIVDRLRSRVLRAEPEATWYGLAGKSHEAKREIIETIAAEAGFPAQLRHEIHQRIALSFAVTGMAASVLGHHDVGLSLEFVALASHQWKGTVPGVVPKIYHKGLWEWPELFSRD
jgi:hypothetical protein